MNGKRGGLQQGFTLVELMLVVAIIGILASVAMPQFNKAVLRARSAERATIMDAIGRSVNEVVGTKDALPTKDPTTPGSGTSWAGADNPPGVPGPQKRLAVMTTAGWENLPVVVQGSLYYTYSFLVNDPGANGSAAEMWVTAVGDLDGDGAPSTKQVYWKARGYAFYRFSETPPAGMEDDQGPQHTF